MNYCPHCGKEVKPDQRFCSNCGNEIKEKTSDTKEPQIILPAENNKNLKRVNWLIIISGILSGFLSLGFIGKITSDIDLLLFMIANNSLFGSLNIMIFLILVIIPISQIQFESKKPMPNSIRKKVLRSLAIIIIISTTGPPITHTILSNKSKTDFLNKDFYRMIGKNTDLLTENLGSKLVSGDNYYLRVTPYYTATFMYKYDRIYGGQYQLKDLTESEIQSIITDFKNELKNSNFTELREGLYSNKSISISINSETMGYDKYGLKILCAEIE
jgi:hypothetical protein